MTDYQADYREAQSSGHHGDCDGHMLTHRVRIERDGIMRRAVCDECGPLHVGFYGASYNDRDVSRMHSDHSVESRCDGRCRNWT